MSTSILAVAAVVLGVGLLAANGRLSRMQFGEESPWPEMDEALRSRGNRFTNPRFLHTLGFKRALARVWYGAAALCLIWAGLQHLL